MVLVGCRKDVLPNLACFEGGGACEKNEFIELCRFSFSDSCVLFDPAARKRESALGVVVAVDSLGLALFLVMVLVEVRIFVCIPLLGAVAGVATPRDLVKKLDSTMSSPFSSTVSECGMDE